MDTVEQRRSDIVDVSLLLQDVWLDHPELRLGQLISIAVGELERLFYMTDAEIARKLNGV